MSELTRFREYAEAMAQGGHTDTCVAAAEDLRRQWSYFRMFGGWRRDDPKPEPPPTPAPCRGECLSAADRELFARLAQEVDDYLEPHPELF